MIKTKSTPNTPQAIRGALLGRGYTVKKFAEEHGFNVHTTRSAIYGSRNGEKVRLVRAKIKEVCSA